MTLKNILLSILSLLSFSLIFTCLPLVISGSPYSGVTFSLVTESGNFPYTTDCYGNNVSLYNTPSLCYKQNLSIAISPSTFPYPSINLLMNFSSPNMPGVSLYPSNVNSSYNLTNYHRIPSSVYNSTITVILTATDLNAYNTLQYVANGTFASLPVTFSFHLIQLVQYLNYSSDGISNINTYPNFGIENNLFINVYYGSSYSGNIMFYGNNSFNQTGINITCLSNTSASINIPLPTSINVTNPNPVLCGISTISFINSITGTRYASSPQESLSGSLLHSPTPSLLLAQLLFLHSKDCSHSTTSLSSVHLIILRFLCMKLFHLLSRSNNILHPQLLCHL
jgi:hypothetical protein